MGNGISTCISLFLIRAGSPVVKARDFHRGGRSSNPPEIKSIKNYNRTTKYYIQARARPFRQVRLMRFFIST